MRSRLLLLLALLFALPVRAAAFEQVQEKGPARLVIRADSSGNGIALADVLTVTITVEGGADLQVDAPSRLPEDAPWILLRREPARKSQPAPGRTLWRMSYELAPQTRGVLKLQFPPLRYREARDWQSVTWEAISVTVTSQVAQVESGKLRDLARIEEVPPAPPTRSRAWLALLALPLLLVPAVGCYLYFRKGTRTSRRQPAREALRECERLRTSKLAEQGQSERFVTLLTTILRRYLERQFQLPARRQTTGEFLQALAAAECFSAEQKEFLATFLQRCDLIKFAGVAASSEECHTLVAHVQRFVETSAAAG
jgi:hypothetical protein